LAGGSMVLYLSGFENFIFIYHLDKKLVFIMLPDIHNIGTCFALEVEPVNIWYLEAVSLSHLVF
jgi:hypothetical protein